MLYFCWQVIKHFKNIQNKDKYSFATFVLLVLSLIMFFTSRVIDFSEQTLKALNDDNS